MATRTEYRCPKCGGTDGEDLCTVWVGANTNEIVPGEMHRAELYTDTRWCPKCEYHPTLWVQVEIEE
jgi:hypothetical protein